MIHVFIYFFEYLFKSFVSKVLYGSLSMENFGINRKLYFEKFCQFNFYEKKTIQKRKKIFNKL